MQRLDTELENLKIRFAEENDAALILGFIKELADYEKLQSEVTATEEIIIESLFQRKVAEVAIGEYEGKPVGYALFFHNFSTFTGKPGIYLEDLYVKPEMRGKGIGKSFLSFLAKLALERDCTRFEWACLDWNKPSIAFYKKMGAVPMEDWTGYRLAGQALKNVAGENR